MTYTQVLQVVSLLVLLGMSAFFAGSETALMSLNRIRLKHLVDKKVFNAGIIYSFLDNPSRLLSTLLIGNNVVNIVSSSIGTVLFISLLGPAYGVPAAMVVVTVMVLVFGEITPKTLASHSSERWSLKVARPIAAMMVVFSPLITIMTWITNQVIRFAGVSTKRANLVTEDEIRTVIHIGQSEGVIKLNERKMLTSVLGFNDTLVREIMVPRIDMFALPQAMNVEQAAREAVEKLYSRIPVFSDSIDNVVGMIHVKDLLAAMLDKPATVLGDVMRTVMFAPETRQIGQLLEQMQTQRVSVAVILDEFGATSGLATIEDIVEEIVGEIEDEYDQQDPAMETLDERETLLDGACSVSDVNEQLGISLPEDLAATIGGFIFFRLGHIPKSGESVNHHNWVLIVEQMDGRRISRVRVHKKG